MNEIIPVKFLCSNCAKELILVKLGPAGKVDLVGVNPCSCKGNPKLRQQNGSNVFSFSLEKERLKNKKERKK